MSHFQQGIFDRSHQHHVFLEFTRNESAVGSDARAALARLADLALGTTVRVTALGPTLWRELDDAFSFPPFSLDDKAPSTQGDLFVWLQDSDRGNLFDASRAVAGSLGAAFSLQLEVNGFVYHDMRDLTGFVDGIGNPQGEKAHQAALVPPSQPGAGGSFVLSQKWVHQLDAFNALAETEQERVIGRTKKDAVEFSADDMPADAHVGRTDVDHDGVPQKIWRRSVPYGSTSEHGLYFLAFSCDLSRFDYLMRRMYGMTGDGITDRLLDYTRPVSGSWWYAPTQEWLSALREG